jgi:flagellar basal-body rod modification protein FlgD
MTSVNPFAALNSPPAGAATTAAGSAGAGNAGSADRFLKLLVAQMQNQDPLNPMDNSQVTSQLAQISTVDGISQLNTTVQGLNQQFVQMQALQGASLVGHDVILPGNQLAANAAGVVQGGFSLTAAADSAQVQVLDAAGQVIDTIHLGAQASGQHSFDWTPPKGVDPTLGQSFKVVAMSGTSALPVTLLMRDRVDAVAAGGSSLTLELQHSGSVPYSQITAFN